MTMNQIRMGKIENTRSAKNIESSTKGWNQSSVLGITGILLTLKRMHRVYKGRKGKKEKKRKRGKKRKGNYPSYPLYLRRLTNSISRQIILVVNGTGMDKKTRSRDR